MGDVLFRLMPANVAKTLTLTGREVQRAKLHCFVQEEIMMRLVNPVLLKATSDGDDTASFVVPRALTDYMNKFSNAVRDGKSSCEVVKAMLLKAGYSVLSASWEQRKDGHAFTISWV